MICLRNIIVLIVLFFMLSCSRQDRALKNTPCDGAFQMFLTGFVNNDICSEDVLHYQMKDNKLQVVIESIEVSGKLRFEIVIESFNGTGSYSFTEGASFCQLTVHGASDEFYKCVKGNIDVREATRQNLQADFDVIIEGFYNKKTIHARGGIHL
jgi:hypothetical protein